LSTFTLRDDVRVIKRKERSAFPATAGFLVCILVAS